MRETKSYQLKIHNQLANIAWISSQELWITEHGILTVAGLRDHFGRDALKEAMKVATTCDHLRFDHGNQNVIIIDALERKGRNLAAHPFRLHCFLKTMWRFANETIVSTLPVYGDAHMFFGWVENIGGDVSKREDKPYERPGNMFSNAVRIDQ
ncbi:hypothetical protein FHS72_002285 [Loktanella ponticola]|uniref:Uncharacterized protein n=1 Tax=Yoonia ponticola TaxID=1524255 RepID=A0A7W9BLH4_9RHOB|nr:hypothetical protein [Yoonia ponticola]MBB5722655.1 hypothetical protein [Yoonia ponticola]